MQEQVIKNIILMVRIDEVLERHENAWLGGLMMAG